MLKEVFIATQNLNKVKEILKIWGNVPFTVITVKDLPPLPPCNEVGNSYKENALYKARWGAKNTGLYSVADDSGLEVEALDGKPGIYSARFGGDGLSYPQKIAHLLSLLKDVEQGKRKARFVCTAVLVTPEGELLKLTTGICEGEIAFAPQGKGGFGFDPVFFLPDLGKTMAQLSSRTKNKLSHRGKAFRELKNWINHFLLKGTQKESKK